MTHEEALRIMNRQRPCEHLNYDTSLGDGVTWARCEDCGATFARGELSAIRKRTKDFDSALDVLLKGRKTR